MTAPGPILRTTCHTKRWPVPSACFDSAGNAHGFYQTPGMHSGGTAPDLDRVHSPHDARVFVQNRHSRGARSAHLLRLFPHVRLNGTQLPPVLPFNPKHQNATRCNLTQPKSVT